MLQQDKILHFLVSFSLVIFFGLIVGLFWGTIITFIIGILKEIYDHYFGTGFSWGDILSNLIGIIIGIVLLVIGG